MHKIKVLITGGAGFIGFHLASYLNSKENYQVDIIDNLSRGKPDAGFRQLVKRENIRFIKADLLKLGAYHKLDSYYDYIYHLCAVVGVRNVMAAPDKVLRVNILPTLYILDWIRKTQKRLKKFLFLSTSEVYSGTLKHYGIKIPTDESVELCLDDIRSPRTTYALSKLVGESACFAYFSGNKFPFTIVRYHNVYGPRMGYEHVIPELFCRAQAARKCLRVYSPRHTRSFCYVADAIKATIRLAEAKNTRGEIFHVGNGAEEIRIKDLAKKICILLNKTLKIEPMPEQAGSPVHRCPDTRKMYQAVRFIPGVTLDDGLNRTWDWYRSHLKKVIK